MPRKTTLKKALLRNSIANSFISFMVIGTICLLAESENLRQDILFLGGFAISMLILSTLMTLSSLRKLLDPLIHLGARTRKVAGGDYRFDKTPPSYAEIDALSEDFSAMAEALKRREEALCESNEQLAAIEEDLRQQIEEYHIVQDELFVDIGKRKEAESALRESELRYRRLLESVTDYIYSVTVEEGTAVSTTHAAACVAVTGYTSRDYDLDPELWFNMVHPDDRKAVLLQADLILSGDNVPPLEHRIMHKDGMVLWIKNTVVRRYDEEGTLVAYDALVSDITGRKLAEEEIKRLNEELEVRIKERTAQLETANNELESFSYSVSHDLRAPLRHISGFSQALMEEYGDKIDTEGKGYLQRLCSASLRMSDLIDALLSLSRLSRSQLSFVPVDLTAMAGRVASDLKQRRPERTVKFNIAKGLTVHGDPGLLHAVMENLLGNAWKYSSKKSSAYIEFAGNDAGAEHMFYVSDNGAGFDMEYVDKLFAPFQRLHREDEFEGTGIGLATVQRIIHRHGGRVWAEGESGKGAKFYFTIPTAVPPVS